MRTKVRYCVEALYLVSLYGEPAPVRSQEVVLPTLEVDEEYYAGASEELVEGVDR